MTKKKSNDRWTKKQLKFMHMLADPLLEKKDEEIAAELNVKPETLLKWRRLPGFQKMAKKLAEVCPVNIFGTDGDGKATIVEENLDECVLCDLCVQAAPPGGVRVVKLYSGEALER